MNIVVFLLFIVKRICGKYIIIEAESYTCKTLINKYDISKEDFELLNQNISCAESLRGKHVCVEFFDPSHILSILWRLFLSILSIT